MKSFFISTIIDLLLPYVKRQKDCLKLLHRFPQKVNWTFNIDKIIFLRIEFSLKFIVGWQNPTAPIGPSLVGASHFLENALLAFLLV